MGCPLQGTAFRAGGALGHVACWNGVVQDDDVDLETALSEIAVELFSSPTVQGTLQRIVDLASSTVDGCQAAGIFVLQQSVASTAAASDQLAVEIDRLQIEAGEGPCLDAAIGGSTFYATDLLDDDRWPIFGPLAVAAGIRSVLAYAFTGDRLSALNLYGQLPAAFGATDRAQGQLFATLATLALESAEERAAGEERAGQLSQALKTREVIGQAQGILMERERITADQAFDVLRRASQRLNLKLRDVARTLVDTGENVQPPAAP